MTEYDTTAAKAPEAVDDAGGWTPYELEAQSDGCELAEWVGEHQGQLDELVDEHPAVLLRGFSVGSAERFQDAFRAMGRDPLQYTQRSTKRLREADGVYTSTEYPQALRIGLHSENSFQSQWPRRIVFCSLVVADSGGVTPLAENSSVFEAISDEVREEFLRRQIKYVRNFGGGLELSWQEAFQSEQRQEVEHYCAENGIAWEWKPGDRLRIEQVLPPAIVSPVRGRPLWFNQAHLFHITNVAPELREALLQAMPEEDLPRHAYFGDGGPIPDEYMDDIRSAYEASAIRFPWRVDDVLVIDNLHVAHGRDAFTGKRKVLVAMSDVMSFSDCEVVRPRQGGE